jgi:hypothetical protein
MQYYALKSSHALQTLEDLRNDKQINLRQVVEIRGHGDDLKALKDVLRDLKNKLNEIRSKYPLILRPHDPSGGKFESEACSIVHSTLPPDPCMLGDYEWWTWLAIVRFRDLVEWRYGPSKPTAPANFGIGSGSENLLYRMWLRADIGYDPKRKDPYELARRGDQDFWRSHVFRQSYGRCRTLVRALILYQFPEKTMKSVNWLSDSGFSMPIWYSNAWIKIQLMSSYLRKPNE